MQCYICFCANEPYARYTATLITSIIHSTDTSKQFGDFFNNAVTHGGGNCDLDSRNLCNSRDLDSSDSSDSRYNSHLDSYPKRDYDSLSDDEKREGYIFHIISDFLSNDSCVRFATLAQNLSQIYPCEIVIHICDDAIFSGLPRLNGNYLAYFRFFISRFMPQNCALRLWRIII